MEVISSGKKTNQDVLKIQKNIFLNILKRFNQNSALNNFLYSKRLSLQKITLKLILCGCLKHFSKLKNPEDHVYLGRRLEGFQTESSSMTVFRIK